MTEQLQGKFLDVGGIKTHYFEAGDPSDKTVVLIHSGEFGASAEMSWERTIPGLSEEFHVLAPDLIGYGKTEKLFDFMDVFDRRIRHVKRFLEMLCVEDAHFIGNSMGAGTLASLACEEPPLDWPIDKMVIVSSGGGTPEAVKEALATFDGSEEEMRKIMDFLFYDYEALGEEFFERKLETSRVPGHWQCQSGVRFDPPFEQEREFRRRHDYENVHVPTLVIGGKEDDLKPPEKMKEMAETIPGAELVLFDETGHCAHLEQPEKFNEVVIGYLSSD